MSHPEHSGEAITIMKVHPILKTGVVVSTTAQQPDGRLEDGFRLSRQRLAPVALDRGARRERPGP